MNVASETEQGRELERAQWEVFFEDLNRRLAHGGRFEATIELIGDQVGGGEAERLPLNSLTYEDGDDEIAIGLGGRGQRYPAALWHFSEPPYRVWVNEQDGAPAAITIQSRDGTRPLMRLYPVAAR